MADTGEIKKKESEITQKAERTRSARVYTPYVDIFEKGNDIIMYADMPGVDEKAVEITLEKRVLSLYGKADYELSGDCELCGGEYGVGDYSRSFTLSDEINRDGIQASLTGGVLKLTLPKAEAAKAKKIAVSAG